MRRVYQRATVRLKGSLKGGLAAAEEAKVMPPIMEGGH